MTALLIAAALVFLPSDAHLAFETARTLVDRHTPRDSGTRESAKAAEFIAAEMTKVGAMARLEAFKAGSDGREREFVNVVAEVARGEETNGWVVLVSHYDTKHGIDCPGANDGAATTGLLVALASAVKRRGPAGVNFMFVFTDGEECVTSYGFQDGLQGSKHAAKALAKSGHKVLAVICADMIGDEDLQISVPVNSSTQLRKLALAAAKDINEPQLVQDLWGHVLDDHAPFLENGFAAIDLIDFSYGPDHSYWHTREDTMEHVSEASLLKSGRLIAKMVDKIIQ